NLLSRKFLWLAAIRACGLFQDGRNLAFDTHDCHMKVMYLFVPRGICSLVTFALTHVRKAHHTNFIERNSFHFHTHGLQSFQLAHGCMYAVHWHKKTASRNP